MRNQRLDGSRFHLHIKRKHKVGRMGTAFATDGVGCQGYRADANASSDPDVCALGHNSVLLGTEEKSPVV